MPTLPLTMLAVVHPWRESPKGNLTLLLDPAVPELRLGKLGDAAGAPEPGKPVDPTEVLGVFTLHKSPDDRVPAVAQAVAGLLAEEMPDWLEARICDLLNNIHGFGTSRNPRGPQSQAGMDHPLAPLGLWGPMIDKVGREVRKGRFQGWQDIQDRLEPMVTQSLEQGVPEVLAADILGARKPQMLLREPL